MSLPKTVSAWLEPRQHMQGESIMDDREHEAIVYLKSIGNIVRVINRNDIEIMYGIEMSPEEWVAVQAWYNDDENVNEIDNLSKEDFEEVLDWVREEMNRAS
jgi:hypothetical protein